ncbi:FadR/GntR family transcriptional regulator [Trueperella sp. LYQ141]
MAENGYIRRLTREKGIAAPLNLTVNSSSEAAETAQLILVRITSGEYLPGDRLPAERTIAEELHTSRTNVREALSVLEILGLVEIMPGSGAYVRSGGADLFSDSLQWTLLLSSADYPNLLRIRSVLEILAVQQAAEHLAQDPRPLRSLRRLRDSLESQEEHLSNEDMTNFVTADAAFHIEIGTLSQNPTLNNLLSTLRRLLQIWIQNQVDSVAAMQVAYDEHLRVYRALSSSDPLSAVQVMREHMNSANERLLAANASKD